MRQKNAKLCGHYALKISELCALKMKIMQNYCLYSLNSLLIIFPKLAANRAEQTLTAVHAVNWKKNLFSSAATHVN